MKGYRDFSTHFAEMDFYNFKIEKVIYVTSQIVWFTYLYLGNLS